MLSGGLDSTVLAHRLRAEGCDLTMLSFNYGQSHRRELEFAYRTAASLGGAHRVVQLGTITEPRSTDEGWTGRTPDVESAL
ncbi:MULTISPECIES: 7-cyano-7-deazaguanine synthase, partial [unclassified Micromonospora]|uniref:7-cyano-7-deazaguanine synthase n=1 Tax=unclassified Micromonospora TaxID=2617518 RepID=UPI003A88CD81